MLLVKLYYACTRPNPQSLLNAANITTSQHSSYFAYMSITLYLVSVYLSLSLFVQHNMYILWLLCVKLENEVNCGVFVFIYKLLVVDGSY